jgi:hypothetical protein
MYVILGTLEVEIQGIHGLRPAQAKLVRPPSQPIIICVVVQTCHPSYLGGINRRIVSWGW